MPALEIALKNIDRLLSLEIQGAALPYGVKDRLFEAVQSIQDGTMVGAAAKILNGPAANIGIVTGAQVPEKMPLGENDGPLGSIVLAAALANIGHAVTFYTDEAAAGPISELITWMKIDADLQCLQPDDVETQMNVAGALDIAVAVERLGGNPNGILYGATGVSRSDFRCNMDPLFKKMSELGKPTIGIADGGNEIGCGKIHEIISDTLSDLNYRDRTPCGGGVFSIVSTDVLVIATTSNLGCAGTVAALALLSADVELCHTEKGERDLIQKGVEIGLTDGGTGKVIAAVDGVLANDHAALVGLMRSVVDRALATPYERGF